MLDDSSSHALADTAIVPPPSSRQRQPRRIVQQCIDASRLHLDVGIASDIVIAPAVRDLYYRRAKEYGYRARSAFKLLQCDDACNIFNARRDAEGGNHHMMRAVDLCAAPGSWSQVLARVVYSADNKHSSSSSSSSSAPLSIPSDPADARIVSVDLQEIAPIRGVCIVRGDITSRSTADRIISHFKGEPVDLVVSDGAPDVTGQHELDEYCQSQLLIAALMLATHLLREGTGVLVMKIFKSSSYYVLSSQLSIFFTSVECIKPTSSRIRSAEHFVVCKGFRRPIGFEAVFAEESATKGMMGETIDDAEKVKHTSVKQITKATSSSSLPSSPSSSDAINESIMSYVRCGDLSVTMTTTIADDVVAPTSASSSSFTRFIPSFDDDD